MLDELRQRTYETKNRLLDLQLESPLWSQGRSKLDSLARRDLSGQFDDRTVPRRKAFRSGQQLPDFLRRRRDIRGDGRLATE